MLPVSRVARRRKDARCSEVCVVFRASNQSVEMKPHFAYTQKSGRHPDFILIVTVFAV
jgi:hypothetical protein